MLINPYTRMQSPQVQQTNRQHTSNSTSFGIKLPIHVRQRMDERGISTKSLMNTIQNGWKFFVIEKGKQRVVSLAQTAEGKVPEGALLVVTDTTGEMVVTAHKLGSGECEISHNQLIKQSHHNSENQRILPRWNGKFDRKIFETLEIIEEAPHPFAHVDMRRRNQRSYY